MKLNEWLAVMERIAPRELAMESDAASCDG